MGRFDAVIHNAGVGYRESRRIETVDGFSQLFAINVLAPYLLTASVTPPDRLVYLSSGCIGLGTLRLTTRNGRRVVGTARKPTSVSVP